MRGGYSSPRGANLCWALGDIICNFIPILPYFQYRGGDEPRPRFFSDEQIKWRPKKRSSPKIEHFFPRIQVETCAQMHTRVKLSEGMQMKALLKLLGRIYPPGFRHPWFSPPPPHQPRYCFGNSYAFKYNSTKCQFWTYDTKWKVIGKFVTVSMWKGETSEEVKMFRKHATPLQHPIDFFDWM